MQNFRFLAVVVALAVSSLPFLTRADDTPAQAAARAALEQQMNGMDTGDTNSPAVVPEPSTPPPMPPPSATAPAVNTNYMWETTPPIASVPPMPTNLPAESTPPPQITVSPQLAAPEQVTNGVYNPSPNNGMTQYPVNPAPASSPQANLPPVTVPPMETPPPAVPPSVVTSPAMPASPGQTNMVTAPATPAQPSAPSETQITAPPLPVSAEKQAALQDLLSRYMANQISPVEYQQERAKILAQPN